MVDFNKKRICHKCGEPATYFYKQWWCGHTKDLKGVCTESKRGKNETNNNT
jgi:hypothetical protein|tara:strand:- start:452 stop:604 length:153 start_codon:yes stop_codon:yes gene_type:complete